MDQEVAEVSAGVRVFAEDVVGQDRQDVLDLMLYAEMSANNKYNKNEQGSKWMDYYQARLVKYGCAMEAFIAPDILVASNWQGFLGLTYKIVGVVGGQEFIGHVKASFEALQITKKALFFFQGYSGSERTVTINISSCELTEKGAVLLLFCGLQLSSSIEVKTLFLEKKIEYDLTIRPNGGAFLFDRDKYATHRADIQIKLKEAAGGVFKP